MQDIGNRYHRDIYAGALMLAIGIAAIWQGSSYSIGTLSRMGPGLFPVALGCILSLVGIAIAVVAMLNQPRGEAVRLAPEWRGRICIILGIAAFVILGAHGGLLPAAFAITFISALGDRQNTIRSALILAVAISLVGVVVFWWALQLQLPLLSWT